MHMAICCPRIIHSRAKTPRRQGINDDFFSQVPSFFASSRLCASFSFLRLLYCKHTVSEDNKGKFLKTSHSLYTKDFADMIINSFAISARILQLRISFLSYHFEYRVLNPELSYSGRFLLGKGMCAPSYAATTSSWNLPASLASSSTAV